jgi:hypothetical protein
MSGLTELKIKHQEYFLGADYCKIKKSLNLNKFVKSFIK